MEIRLLRETDSGRIAEIQASSPEASQWNSSDYLGFETWVAEQDGDVIGFLSLRETGGGEAEVLNMAVDPGSRRLGVARSLLNRALEGRFQEVYLEVRESNGAALRLYESMGFRRAGVRPKYYERPKEAGIVMKRQKW